MRLFEEARHESLTREEWDARAAERAIEEIAADVLAASADGGWATHPLDEDAPSNGATLYMGAAGVVWGLRHLAASGLLADDEQLRRWALALPERYAAAPDTGAVVPSYFLGETGVLLTALRAEHRADWADALYAAIERNIDNPTREALWGAPGTMLAAVFAHELTGEERWAALYRNNAAALLRTWEPHPMGGDLWLQDLYGSQRHLLGAGHGFAGNVFALLRGRTLLPADERRAVLERATKTLSVTAAADGDCVNWRPVPGASKILVQWCHGAPGIVTSFGPAPPEPQLDALLCRAGELIWRAGPLRKGPSLCHGTAGNGAAFLTLFARTGDVQWLDYARRFAMHAIGQVAAARAEYGQGRYSLWTGDVGVAVYLAQCLEPSAGMPSLDF